MAANGKPPKKCLTVIPAHWPKLTGPAWREGMSFSEARTAWFDFLRIQQNVRPTPRVYRKD